MRLSNRIAVVLILLVPWALRAEEFKDRWSTPPTTPNPLLAHHTFKSEAAGVEVGYNIYLPPGYDDPASTRRYPVFYWLHGMNQSESRDQYPVKILDAAIAQKKVPPMILVYASGGQRTFYSDSADGKILAETIIIKELIPHIDKTYRTVATRDGRALQGMSMGGYGALKLAFKHPDLFCSVTAYAPALRTPEEMAKARREILDRIFGGDEAKFLASHPETLLRQNLEQIRGKLPIALYIGTKDYLLPGAQSIHKFMTELKVEHTYEEVPGVEHNLVKLSGHVQEKTFEFAARYFR